MLPKHLPMSDEEWRGLVGLVSASDDRVEGPALERKGGEVDPRSKSGAAKIARFVLGAANRRVGEGSDVLGGHAVLLVGIEKDGRVTGAALEDSHQLKARVRKWVGEEPDWDPIWVRVSEGLDVLAVVVRPPSAGDPIRCALADGESIRIGAIYVRRGTETAEALPGEIGQLVERAKGAHQAPPQVDVRYTGSIHRFTLSRKAFLTPIEGTADRMLAEFEEQTKQDRTALSGLRKVGSASEYLRVAAFMTEQESRTNEQFISEVNAWRYSSSRRHEAARRAMIPYATQCQGHFVVENRGEDGLEGLELSIHIPGDVQAHEADTHYPSWAAVLPERPRPWGPRAYDNLIRPQIAANLMPRGFPSGGGPRATFENGGSVTVSVSLDELRQGAEEPIDEEPLILEGAPESEVVVASWKATVRGRRGFLSGEFHIPVGEPVSLDDLWTGRAAALRRRRERDED